MRQVVDFLVEVTNESQPPAANALAGKPVPQGNPLQCPPGFLWAGFVEDPELVGIVVLIDQGESATMKGQNLADLVHRLVQEKAEIGGLGQDE
jgi:hypothetical protein